MEKKLFAAINEYLDKVTEDNFSSMYDGLAAIVIDYNKQGMGSKAIHAALNTYYDEFSDSMSDWQDEAFLEISNCVYGYCAPYKHINLLD